MYLYSVCIYIKFILVKEKLWDMWDRIRAHPITARVLDVPQLVSHKWDGNVWRDGVDRMHIFCYYAFWASPTG
jgi:hypothetical protein